jgi:hypothetical protein
MKGYLLIGALILLAIIVAILWRVTAVPETIPSSIPSSSATTTGAIPTSGVTTGTGSVTVPNTQTLGTPSFSTTDQDGMTVGVNDFIHASSTLPDPSNKGNYYLTGFASDGFVISYSTSGQFFTIALQKEPLGETRRDAEQFLLSSLGVSQTQLCNLRYYLGTDVHTSSFYAGKNLGFSFCPGAAQLPE